MLYLELRFMCDIKWNTISYLRTKEAFPSRCRAFMCVDVYENKYATSFNANKTTCESRLFQIDNSNKKKHRLSAPGVKLVFIYFIMFSAGKGAL